MAIIKCLTPDSGRIPLLQFESPTDYVGNLVYKDGVLEKILIDGGFITASDGRYHFFVTDHLGNVRVVVNDAGVIEQVNQFYPYGESIELDPASANPGLETITENPYKWSGKEWDEEQNAYDFGARMYSASDARWTTMDPLCEKYYSISPYSYCAGNPVNLVDPDGMQWYSYRDEAGNLRYTYYEGEMPEEEQKKYSNIQLVGYAFRDGNQYYSLFGRVLPLYVNGKHPAIGQLYEKIDELLIKRATDLSDENGYSKRVNMHIKDARSKITDFTYSGVNSEGETTFSTIPTKKGAWTQNGSVYNNVFLENAGAAIVFMPERRKPHNEHLGSPKLFMLTANNYLNGIDLGFEILRLVFSAEDAAKFMHSYNTIFFGGHK